MLYVDINLFTTYTLSNILAYNCSCSLWSFIFLWYHLIACFLFLILFESSLFFFIILAKWFLISCAFKEPGLLFIIFYWPFRFCFIYFCCDLHFSPSTYFVFCLFFLFIISQVVKLGCLFYIFLLLEVGIYHY